MVRGKKSRARRAGLSRAKSPQQLQALLDLRRGSRSSPHVQPWRKGSRAARKNAAINDSAAQ